MARNKIFQSIDKCKDRVGTEIHAGDKVVHIYTSRYGSPDFVKATILKMGIFVDRTTGEALSPVRLFVDKKGGVQSYVYANSVIAIKQ